MHIETSDVTALILCDMPLRASEVQTRAEMIRILRSQHLSDSFGKHMVRKDNYG